MIPISRGGTNHANNLQLPQNGTPATQNTPTGRVEQDDRLTSPQFEARVFDAIAMITGGLPPRDIITQPGRIVRPGTRGLGAEEA